MLSSKLSLSATILKALKFKYHVYYKSKIPSNLPRSSVRNALILLIHFDSSVDSTCKGETRQETNTTAEHAKADADHGHVGQVDDNGQDSNEFKAARQEPQAV